MDMSRQTPSGKLLIWRLTNPLIVNGDGIIPDFIDWGNTLHPALIATIDCPKGRVELR